MPPTGNFLEAISSKQLGVHVNGAQFIAVQTMNERFRQEITYRGSFGFEGSVIRSLRPADENTISFSFILLNEAIKNKMNSYKFFAGLQDFEVKTRKGAEGQGGVREGATMKPLYEVWSTYDGCNWTDVGIDSTLDLVTVNMDISFPTKANWNEDFNDLPSSGGLLLNKVPSQFG